MPLEPSPEIVAAVMESSAKYGVEPALIIAHMRRESAFKPMAYRAEPQINDASMGLMQVLLKTAQWIMADKTITQQQLYNIKFNVDVGTKYISMNMKRYKGDYHKAIAAYNAGSARYKKGTNIFINQPYVDFVYGWYIRYKEKYQPGGGALVMGAAIVAMMALI